MEQTSPSADVTVSQAGALIPFATLRAAGFREGDRISIMRTTRGTLLLIPHPPTSPASLQALVGIAPRPEGVSEADDQAFLRAIRVGDDDV